MTSRVFLIPWLLLVGAIMSLSLAQSALAHGGGGRGGGGHGGGGGFGGGGFGGGGHFGGGSFGGYGGGGLGGAHYGSFGGYGGTHFGGESFGAGHLGSGVYSGGAISGGRGRLGVESGMANTLHPGEAFRSNWGHNFDRWNGGEFRGHEGEERRERFGYGYGGYGYFGGYPFSDFSYLPYSYPYGDYSDFGVGGYPDYSSYDYSMPIASDVGPDYGLSGGVDTAQPGIAEDNSRLSSAGEFHSAALDAFRRGDYHEAIRLAEHAAIDNPKDVKVHQLMAQALFALGIYRGAAIEAHAALALGPAMNWDTLYGYYGDASAFTTQLRKLEKYAGDHPKAPDAAFLLGYQYQMTGFPKNAIAQYLEAIRLVPADKLAAKIVTELGGKVPANVAKAIQPPPNAAKVR